jgi:hypothetical protein
MPRSATLRSKPPYPRHMHLCTHAPPDAHAPHMPARACTCAHASARAHTHTHTHTHPQTGVPEMGTGAHMLAHIHACLRKYMHTHRYTHTHAHTHTHTFPPPSLPSPLSLFPPTWTCNRFKVARPRTRMGAYHCLALSHQLVDISVLDSPTSPDVCIPQAGTHTRHRGGQTGLTLGKAGRADVSVRTL